MRTLIIAVGALVTALTGSLHGAEPPENSKALTPEQIAQQRPKEEVAVEFWADRVSLEGWSMEWLLEEGPRGDHGGDPPIRLESNVAMPGAGAGQFYVLLTGEAAHKAAKAVQHLAPKEDQDSLCVVRLYKPLKKHFTGQKVIATGKINRIKLDRTILYADGRSEGPATFRTDYVMEINKPENVRFVAPLPANDSSRPAEKNVR